MGRVPLRAIECSPASISKPIFMQWILTSTSTLSRVIQAARNASAISDTVLHTVLNVTFVNLYSRSRVKVTFDKPGKRLRIEATSSGSTITAITNYHRGAYYVCVHNLAMRWAAEG